MNNIFSVSFDICALNFVSDKLQTSEDYLNFAEGKISLDDLSDLPADVSFLPAIQRRRLGKTARLLIASAYPIVLDKKLPVIYASLDGEINKSFDLYLSGLADNLMSQNTFSLSVHNAPIGQWSLIRDDNCASTAISSDIGNLEFAILEALAQLQENNQEVLIIVCNIPLDKKYDIPNVERNPFSYALSLIIKKGSTWTMSCSILDEDTNDHKNLDSGINWYINYLQNSSKFVNRSGNILWIWERK